MPVAERAKQFMPFAALRGLPEALAEKEKVRVPRRVLSDEQMEILNQKLLRLHPGEIVTVVYYDEKERTYRQLTGAVARVEAHRCLLQIGSASIAFADLFDLVETERVSPQSGA